MLKCGSDDGSVPDSWQCLSPPVSPRHGQLGQLTCSGHAHGQVQVERVRHLAQLIDHIKPDTENLLLSAAIRKRELLDLAGLVLLSDGVDIRSRREALVLLRWCAATQPVASNTKVMEEVEFLTIQAQHGLSQEAKQWASAGLAMLACQKETEKLVLGSGSASVLSSLMLKTLAQPGVDLHFDILAQCGRFITHVTRIYTELELELAQICITQLAGSVTERLVMELGGGGDVAAEACLTLLDLLETQPQAFADAFRGTETDADQWHGVAAVVAAVVAALHEELDRDTSPAPGSDDVPAASGSGGQAEGVLKQPLSCEGRTKGLAFSLLSLLRHLLELSETSSKESVAAASSEAATAAAADEGSVSLLVRCLPGEGGADAMRSLALLLGVPKARADLLAAEGGVDEVASQWRLAPAAAAQALWHMRQQPQGRLQFETLLQLLRHPASPDESSGSSCRRYGDALECVKSIETSGAWGSWDPPQQGAPQDLLAALDLCWGHLQELPRSQDTAECEAILMELWALLSRRPRTAAQLAEGGALTVEGAAAGTVEGALPCSVRAALRKLEDARVEEKEKAVSSHMALLLNLLRACRARQLQPSWMRQVLDSFLPALHLQLQHHAADPCLSRDTREPPDLEALQLCTQLCLMSSGDEAQLQPLTPHMLLLLPTTWTCSSPEDGSPPGAPGFGSVERPAAPWCPLDVLEAKLGLVQRLMAAGAQEDVLHLLPPQLLSGPLASDAPPPPSDYTPLLNATPDAMRHQVLELLRQEAEAHYRALPNDCWVREILDQALDAARSCKGGEPCRQKLANCVAVAALWLDVVLQPDVEVSDDADLQQSVRERLQGMVLWALELLQLLMECTAAADALMPTVAPAPTTVLEAAGSILELLCLQLHNTGPLPGLSPPESRRWFLPGGRLRAATPEQRSLMTVMATAATAHHVAAEAKEQEQLHKAATEKQEQRHMAEMEAFRAEIAALRTKHATEPQQPQQRGKFIPSYLRNLDPQIA